MLFISINNTTRTIILVWMEKMAESLIMRSMREKIRFHVYIGDSTKEKEFSLVWIASYNNRTTIVTRSE